MIFSEMKFLEENTCICIDIQLSDQFIIQTKQSLCIVITYSCAFLHQNFSSGYGDSMFPGRDGQRSAGKV